MKIRYKITFLFVLHLLFIEGLKSQNLVQNESFEDTIKCANYPGLPKLPSKHWFSASGGSPDYFSSIYDPSCGFTGVPNNGSFGYQFPKTGNAMCGFGTYLMWGPGTVNYREYVEGILSDTLQQGHKYCVQFHINLANSSKYAVDKIGAYLSNDSLMDYGTNQALNVTPQILNPFGSFIDDTLNWVLISGEYIAQGGEKFITIGNFYDDNNTDTLSMTGGLPWVGSYYFIDDVSVTDCTVGIDEIKNNEIEFVLLPNPVIDKVILQIQGSMFNVQRIEILNSIGQIVLQNKEFNFKNNQIEINIAMLPKGIYILKLVTDKGFRADRFLKE